MLALMVRIPVYDREVVPTLQRCTTEGGISQLQRVGIGLVPGAVGGDDGDGGGDGAAAAQSFGQHVLGVAGTAAGGEAPDRGRTRRAHAHVVTGTPEFIFTTKIKIVIFDSRVKTPQIGLYALAKALSQKGVAKKIQVEVIAKACVPIVKFAKRNSETAFNIKLNCVSDFSLTRLYEEMPCFKTPVYD
ncbi:hypothetical protein ABZP36_030969 [Zizania latifolia]